MPRLSFQQGGFSEKWSSLVVTEEIKAVCQLQWKRGGHLLICDKMIRIFEMCRSRVMSVVNTVEIGVACQL